MEQAVTLAHRLILSGGHHQIVTINGAMLVQAARVETLRRLFNSASLATADGTGVLVAARILGRPAPERVPGIDLVERLCGLSAREGFRVFLLGARPEVVEAAAEALQQRYPEIRIAGAQHGYFAPHEEGRVIQRIREAQPHLLLVAMGSPRQEEWIAVHRESIKAAVCIGVGGTFDVFAGRVRRAPPWVQRAGLEWAYRSMQEPRRWRVIVSLPKVVWLAVRERIGEEWKRFRNGG